ncbi:MAG: hypothetical protein N2234_03905 [Planctomycetota bacterium]|nr:hypothetical protein [Planctomycetota bacterium]
MNWLAERIKSAFAKGWWTATEGQSYLRNQTVVDKSSSGDVVVKSVRGPMSNPPAWCTFVGGKWQVTLTTGEIPSQGWMHEMAHGWFGFSDEEYNCVNTSAGVCVRALLIGGTGEGFQKFCDDSNCKQPSVGPCWPRIIGKHSDWKHPGPGGTMPTCNVTVTNQ